jgi:hypothetical protein
LLSHFFFGIALRVEKNVYICGNIKIKDMKRSLKVLISCALVAFALSSCASMFFFPVNSARLKRLELGMTKEEVTRILGRDFQIVEKRIEDENEIAVLSYAYSHREFYLFRFVNGRLEEWHREFSPSNEVIVRQN